MTPPLTWVGFSRGGATTRQPIAPPAGAGARNSRAVQPPHRSKNSSKRSLIPAVHRPIGSDAAFGLVETPAAWLIRRRSYACDSAVCFDASG